MSPANQTEPINVYSATAFRGRVYGVTGSAHGIGEATVKQLAQLDAAVVVVDLDPENLKRVEKDLKDQGANALCLRGDVADETFLRKTIRAAHKRWGRIDGWVNNAMYNPGGQPGQLPARDFDRTWRVNVGAAWNACAQLIPIMEKQGGGSIVSVSSIMAHLPHSWNTAYCLTKSAVEGFTRSAAVDLAAMRIRVNAVVPGTIYTGYGRKNHTFCIPGIPMAVLEKSKQLRRRLREHTRRTSQPWPSPGEARDVADAILFLLSDAARFITGVCLPVDGGAGSCRPPLWQLDAADMMKDAKALHAIMNKYPTLRMRHLMRRHKKRIRGRAP